MGIEALLANVKHTRAKASFDDPADQLHLLGQGCKGKSSLLPAGVAEDILESIQSGVCLHLAALDELQQTVFSLRFRRTRQILDQLSARLPAGRIAQLKSVRMLFVEAY